MDFVKRLRTLGTLAIASLAVMLPATVFAAESNDTNITSFDFTPSTSVPSNTDDRSFSTFALTPATALEAGDTLSFIFFEVGTGEQNGFEFVQDETYQIAVGTNSDAIGFFEYGDVAFDGAVYMMTLLDDMSASLTSFSFGGVNTGDDGCYQVAVTTEEVLPGEDVNFAYSDAFEVGSGSCADADPNGGDGNGDNTTDQPQNDVDTGDGDGTDDTAEVIGDVSDVESGENNMVTVSYGEYEGETIQKTFQLFTGSANAKVELHTNGEVLIAINKKYMRTYNAFTGEKLDQVKLFKNKQAKTKLYNYNVYKKKPGQNNVMVLARYKTTQKKKANLRSYVVKNGGAIVRRDVQKITLDSNAKFSKLSVSKNSKNGKKARIRVEKNNSVLSDLKYKVTKKKGILKLITE